MGIRKTRSRRLVATVSAVVGLAAVLVAAFSLSSAGARTAAPAASARAADDASTLTILNDTGLPFDCNFNPFRPSLNGGDVQWGYVYEPLVVANQVYKPGVGVPKQYNFLASSYAWNKNNTAVTFTIRPGVKWSDGQPLTADDVLFTFNLIKKIPALDVGGAWQALSSIRQEGTDKIVATIKPGHVPGFYAIASNTYIAPKHIWESIKDPTNEKDPHPVGSGPFTVTSCSPQLMTYDKNPSYWQADKVKVTKIIYPNYTSNDTANHELESSRGDTAWGFDFIPAIEKSYIAKNPKYRHYWFPPVQNWSLTPNTTNPLLKDPRVRQAIAYAIDRNAVATKAEFNYTLPASQTGNLQTFKAWYNKAADAKYGYFKHSPAKAAQLLQQAGFKKGSDGIFVSSAGKRLKLSIIVVGAFSDSVTAATVMSENLKAAGIDASVESLAGNVWSDRLAKGDFTLAWAYGASGVTPYFEYYNLLDSANSAPIGKAAPSNYERWQDPTTDKLLADYGKTLDPAQQRKIINKIQQIMVDKAPVIPVLQGVTWGEWGDKTIVGWPTPQNPYVSPCGYCTQNTSVGVILTHIHPR